ncbi:probable N-acetyltransferase CML1 [Nematostella vectensis]|uniref:probable N-acetyltransferase CML1 n=1 Tax=Nematostella vectensis TaxID=45351 RepID=UPI0020771922|nr:probable N-acetyltransferase CML1 [Nematostella vectensis]XP_032232339.2 probable N-acetyltransferase CML1 [Nematostella vectensis]XP_032232340.2 probable N-acetyltransferase CML1 [Nematostella vectensis]XP_032232341.2 probable N-acetyltransferase CML1 [Nematostella vectensis]XP_048590172.1 probable N-acetyltransferase CML1 [Nematostella vectensis]
MTYSTSPEALPRDESKPDVVRIRTYEPTDYTECREIFTEGMQQLANPVMELVLPWYAKNAAVFFVFAAAVAFQWSLWILAVYLLVCILLVALLYINIYLEIMKFIGACLSADLRDIDKSYMYAKGSSMWVAEYNGKVAGMVGLIHSENHPDGVAELQRMSVSSSVRRKGIAGKLIRELLNFAREQNYKKIVLSTTGAQHAAIGMYKKFGFRLVNVFPYPQKILEDLRYNCFELDLTM